MKGEVKVLGTWASPYTMRVRSALHIKSLEYEFIVATMRPKCDLLLKSNPVHKKIPVFFHHDKPIPESLVILEYIDEIWSSSPPSILATDPYDRAIQRFWASYVDDKLWPPLLEGSMALGEDEEAKTKASLEQVKDSLALLEEAFKQCSKGKPFFSGDKIGYLDIVLGSFLAWIKGTEKLKNSLLLDVDMFPCLVAWSEKFSADDAVKCIMPDIDELVEFMNALASYFIESP